MDSSNKQPSKRSRNETDSDLSSSENDDIGDFWPRYLVISAVDKNAPLRLSPFAVQKGVEGIGGKPVNIRKLQSGDLVVQVDRKAHAMNLLKMKEFVGHPVTCTPHSSMNYTKGILRCREIADCSEEEILNELQHRGVKHLKRFSIKRNCTQIMTNT